MPSILRPPAMLIRNLRPRAIRRYRYPYRADDIATAHRSPFLEDESFNALYAQVRDDWQHGLLDNRWRLWVLSRLARERAGYPTAGPGNFAEFGVYRGGCALIILSSAQLVRDQRYFLFDTFEGIPTDRLTDNEAEIEGDFADASLDEVLARLAPWRPRLEPRQGDVFDTLEVAETGPLAFVHMDLNASAPTVRALEYCYARLVSGAIVVFDDYGQERYGDQRRAVELFFSDRPESVVALPTGQGLLFKR